MKSRRYRHAAWIAGAILVALSAIPAVGTTSPGTISISTPVANDAIRATKRVRWTWTTGSYVRSTRTVDVYASRNGFAWYPIALRVPIRNGSVAWDTTKWVDAVYHVRTVVTGTPVRATRSNIYLDNASPTVQIANPKEGDVVVDDDHVATFAVIVGSVTLSAVAGDALSGLASVEWFLGEEKIADGSRETYDFGTRPGEHELTARATDKAGNTASHTITIMVLPGPSTITNLVPAPDEGTIPSPEDLPLPNPSALPTPTDVGTPDPDDLPSTTPSPAPSPPTGVPTVPSLP